MWLETAGAEPRRQAASKRAKTRSAASAVPDVAPPPTPAIVPAQPPVVEPTIVVESAPRWEVGLEKRALRGGWDISPERQAIIVNRLMGIVDWRPPTDASDLTELAPPSYRDRTSAAKALFAAFKLQIEKGQTQGGASVGTNAGPVEPFDETTFAWYAESCPCGLPPGECREHPRARASQRPPDGDWTVWFLMAGRGSGKTRAAPSGSDILSRTTWRRGSRLWRRQPPTSAT